jgi:hypothetical protein
MMSPNSDARYVGNRKSNGELCVQGRKWANKFALAIAILFLGAGHSIAANVDMVREFGRICVAPKSLKELKAALVKDEWKAFASLAQTHLEREIKAVTPMLEAQGLSSDYTIYGWDVGRQHLELAVSETKKPVSGDRRLVGCSIYDFAATSPIDSAAVDVFAPTTVGQKSTVGDMQVEKWDNAFGEGSGMRAVFVPAASPMSAQIGFTGMMLGTHFLDRFSTLGN